MTEILKHTPSEQFVDSLPEYVTANYPEFVQFLIAYYEWLEQDGNAYSALKGVRSNRDIDTAVDKYVEHITNELMPSIPVDVLADRRLLAKHIKALYETKGTEQSYKLLFKVLFNENIELYYPSEDILRVSDGKWFEERSIKVGYVEGLRDLVGMQITGANSGAIAMVDNILISNQGDLQVGRVMLSTISGDFEPGEVVTGTTNKGVDVSTTVYGTPVEVIIDQPGTGYKVGDTVPIHGDGINARARVKSLESSGQISDAKVVDGGTGYAVGDPISFISSQSGIGAEGIVESISDTYSKSYNTDLIQDHQNVLASDVASTVISDYLTFATYQLGSISSIKVTYEGNYYSDVPDVEIGYNRNLEGRTQTGTGAVIEPIGSGFGRIRSVEISNFGVDYTHAVADFTGSGDGNATGTVRIGALNKYSGYYLNDDGKLSSYKRIQDSNYYQQYSYVIKVLLELDRYRDIVKQLLHPAGMKMFGEYPIRLEAASPSKVGTNGTRRQSHVRREITLYKTAPQMDASRRIQIETMSLRPTNLSAYPSISMTRKAAKIDPVDEQRVAVSKIASMPSNVLAELDLYDPKRTAVLIGDYKYASVDSYDHMTLSDFDGFDVLVETHPGNDTLITIE